jgi:hypothetical protein
MVLLYQGECRHPEKCAVTCHLLLYLLMVKKMIRPTVIAKAMDISLPQVGAQSMATLRQTPSNHRSTRSSANTSSRELHMVANIALPGKSQERQAAVDI